MKYEIPYETSIIEESRRAATIGRTQSLIGNIISSALKFPYNGFSLANNTRFIIYHPIIYLKVIVFIEGLNSNLGPCTSELMLFHCFSYIQLSRTLPLLLLLLRNRCDRL